MAKSRKRKHNSIIRDPNASPGVSSEDPPSLPVVRFGEFKLTTNSGITRPPSPSANPKDPGTGWEHAGWERAGKRQKKHKPEIRNGPEIMLSPQKLRSPVKVADLQNLVLWLLADGVAPQWLMVKVCFPVLYAMIAVLTVRHPEQTRNPPRGSPHGPRSHNGHVQLSSVFHCSS